MKGIVGLRNLEQHSRVIRDTLERIRLALELPSSDWLDLIHLTQREYELIWRGKRDITLPALMHASNGLKLTMGQLLSGNIDYPALRAHFQGDFTVLPERYAPENQRLSRARGVQVILQYLNAFLGPHYVNRALEKLQLRSFMFDDLEQYVSPLIGVDILNDLEKVGFRGEQFKEIGKMTFTVSQNDLGKTLSQQKSPQDLYEYLHEALPAYYDRLFLYKLERLTKYGCTVKVFPRVESQDCFRTHVIGNRALCLYKQGVYGSFLANLSRQYAEVSESDCLYKGDAFCKYDISWSSALLH